MPHTTIHQYIFIGNCPTERAASPLLLQMASSENSSSNGQYFSSSRGNANRQESEVHFSKDEVALMIRMHNLVGDRWSLIAGRIPGRTAEEIKKYWIEKKDAYKEQ